MYYGNDKAIIPLDQIKEWRLYRIRSRNLGPVGVATGNGFTGIREKFGHHFLFTEYHAGNGPPFGTCAPFEELPEDMPPEIERVIIMPTVCEHCGKPAEFVAENPPNERWKHVTPQPRARHHVSPVSSENAAMRKWLEEMEQKYPCTE